MEKVCVQIASMLKRAPSSNSAREAGNSVTYCSWVSIPLVASSIILFYCGIAFAYFVVFPLMFAFFNAVTPAGVQMMTDISSYLDFILTIFFAFGIAFEVPIATVMLVATGITSPESLGRKRPYVFLGAFVIGMFLTPPDVISQTLLAVPIYLLFEAGIIMSRLILKEREEKDMAGDKEA